jgi:hypothetical protein
MRDEVLEYIRRARREALDQNMTLKELVNRAVEEYLRKKPRTK